MRYVIRNKRDHNLFWSTLYKKWVVFSTATAMYSDERVNIMLPPNGVWVAL